MRNSRALLTTYGVCRPAQITQNKDYSKRKQNKANHFFPEGGLSLGKEPRKWIQSRVTDSSKGRK